MTKKLFEKCFTYCTRPLFWNARQGCSPPFLNAEGYILGDFELQNPQNWGAGGRMQRLEDLFKQLLTKDSYHSLTGPI